MYSKGSQPLVEIIAHTESEREEGALATTTNMLGVDDYVAITRIPHNGSVVTIKPS